MTSLPDKAEAQNIFEYVIRERNLSLHPFCGNMETTFRKHCQDVAEICETLAARTAYLNPEKAYVLGLLHDCGRIIDERGENRHHDVVGYELMMSLGFNEVARICITHNYVIQDKYHDMISVSEKDIEFGLHYVSEIEYDDYDLLIQLADSINGCGISSTIEERFADITIRYNIPYATLEPIVAKANEIKFYIDTLCGEDVYRILNIKNIRQCI